MKTKVAYVTTARSDYGPSYWVIRDLFADSRFEASLIATGSHLGAEHGRTVREIESAGWPRVIRIPFLGAGENALELARSAGKALTAFGKFFSEHRFDIAILCGDRYELLPIATAALVSQTPIAHLWGGDLTEGAIDNQVRHALTKLAHLHFPCTASSAARIRQMGEEPWRIHPVGDSALDHFVRGRHATADELADFLGFKPDACTLLVTFHPCTLELDQIPRQARELAGALRACAGPVVITAPAPDPGGAIIRGELQKLVRARPQTVFVESLGSYRYRGLLSVVGAVVGNSSSGLIEAASVPVPVVNIGNRQRGRERAANVLDVPPRRADILEAIAQACSPRFRRSLAGIKNPYGDGRAAARIVGVLAKLPERAKLLNKRFKSAYAHQAAR